MIKCKVTISELKLVGCKEILWNDQKVSLICYNQGFGNIVHLFQIPKSTELQITQHNPKSIVTINGLQTIEWNDQSYSYILIGSNPDVDLQEYRDVKFITI